RSPRCPWPGQLVFTARRDAVEPRYDLAMADRQKLAIPLKPGCVLRLARLRPVKPRCSKRRLRIRIGDVLLRFRIGEFGVMRELSASSLTDRLVERWPEIAEEGKGPSARPFLAHEQKRDLGRQQHDRGRR